MDGRLLVLLGLAGVTGAAAVRGSRGVVRSSRQPSDRDIGAEIVARVSQALDRLRARDRGSVRDAKRCMSFSQASWLGYGLAYSAIDQDDLRGHWPFMSESTSYINHAIQCLDFDGDEGIDRAVEDLRMALDLDRDFLPRGGSRGLVRRGRAGSKKPPPGWRIVNNESVLRTPLGRYTIWQVPGRWGDPGKYRVSLKPPGRNQKSVVIEADGSPLFSCDRTARDAAEADASTRKGSQGIVRKGRGAVRKQGAIIEWAAELDELPIGTRISVPDPIWTRMKADDPRSRTGVPEITVWEKTAELDAGDPRDRSLWEQVVSAELQKPSEQESRGGYSWYFQPYSRGQDPREPRRLVNVRLVMVGSAGIVRGGKLNKPARNIAAEFRARVNQALGRLRDKEAGSVNDALRCLSFSLSSPGGYGIGRGYPAIAGGSGHEDWPFNVTDTGLIQHAILRLERDGGRGIDVAIEDLRLALDLNRDFEPHGSQGIVRKADAALERKVHVGEILPLTQAPVGTRVEIVQKGHMEHGEKGTSTGRGGIQYDNVWLGLVFAGPVLVHVLALPSQNPAFRPLSQHGGSRGVVRRGDVKEKGPTRFSDLSDGSHWVQIIEPGHLRFGKTGLSPVGNGWARGLIHYDDDSDSGLIYVGRDTQIRILSGELRRMVMEAAGARSDCNISPRIVGYDGDSYEGFVHIEVQYDAVGHQALYEYRLADGMLTLAED